MKTIARHLIAEFYGCQRPILDDVGAIAELLRAAAAAVGATILGESFHRFAPQGVSGTLVIAESHLSIHTWPEHAYVAVDLFTCGGLDPNPGYRALAEGLLATETRKMEIARGLPEHVAEGRPWLPRDIVIVERVEG